MPSGRASRKQRQAGKVPPPPVRVPGSPRVRSASPRVLAAAGAIVVAAAVAIAVAVFAVGGGSSSTDLSTVPAVGSVAGGLPEAGYVNTLFKGIPQNGNILGKSSAPVTMVEFIDLQCPYCAEFETQVMPNLIKRFVRPGIVKVEMQPWAFIGPDSTRGQAAVFAAAKQNAAFNYAELLYLNQQTENTGWLNDNMVTAAARSIPGLRVHVLLNERSSATVKDAQQKVASLAAKDKVNSTPTIFVGKSGGHGTEVKMSSPTDEQSVVNAINAARG